jgi:Sugar (and other) transporter
MMATIAVSSDGAPRVVSSAEQRRVIFGASLGTVFEWYDFYLYGSLAAPISKHFFSGVNPTAAFILTLMAFAAGFAVRPFGALIFGRVGDLVGRKYTFLVTIAIMGLSTFLVGVLPTYDAVGIVAPAVLVALRLLQGLALGGEYGGAATYVAEHAPKGKLGFSTSWIQTTATVGLLLSLLLILLCRGCMSAASFDDWGWRVPFLVSIVLLAVSLWIRLKLTESPIFQQMQREGKGSKAPLTDSFARWGNIKIVLIALFGLIGGQGVVWCTGQLYVLFFLTQTLRVDPQTSSLLIALSLVIGTPFFIVFGGLSDRVGRKPIIMAGLLLAVITYFPIFKAITHYANPVLEAAIASSPVVVTADPAECSFQFNPVGTTRFTSSCDIAKAALANRGIPYSNMSGPAGTIARINVSATPISSYDGALLDAQDKAAAFNKAVADALKAAGYPAAANPTDISYFMTIVMLTILIIYVTMVYGPLAAMLVEMFPTRIRYTSMSLPYHIGNGWIGGFMPATSFAIVAASGNIYDGLWYPVVIVGMTLVIGLVFVRETKDVDISA